MSYRESGGISRAIFLARSSALYLSSNASHRRRSSALDSPRASGKPGPTVPRPPPPTPPGISRLRILDMTKADGFRTPPSRDRRISEATSSGTRCNASFATSSSPSLLMMFSSSCSICRRGMSPKEGGPQGPKPLQGAIMPHPPILGSMGPPIGPIGFMGPMGPIGPPMPPEAGSPIWWPMGGGPMLPTGAQPMAPPIMPPIMPPPNGGGPTALPIGIPHPPILLPMLLR
mmetsp:Transcript_52175/g.167159  ORF Transcript_52175/g.167159 Transcript_52175/m.167159 type:complete len:230 (-) Transcript_52175:617-1306(-)